MLLLEINIGITSAKMLFFLSVLKKQRILLESATLGSSCSSFQLTRSSAEMHAKFSTRHGGLWLHLLSFALPLSIATIECNPLFVSLGRLGKA